MSRKNPVLLEHAKQCLLAAIERDTADFNNYEKLTTVYNLLRDYEKAYDYELQENDPGLCHAGNWFSHTGKCAGLRAGPPGTHTVKSGTAPSGTFSDIAGWGRADRLQYGPHL